MDGQTDRQAGRQTDRQREREREREKKKTVIFPQQYNAKGKEPLSKALQP